MARHDLDRRLLIRSAAALGVGAAAASTALIVRDRITPLTPTGAAAPMPALPSAATPNPVPGAQPFSIKGISSYITPNEEFYRIDTALLIPRIEVDDWRLVVDGEVDRPTTFTYAELAAAASAIEPVTLSCVSNEVGGDLVGNAVWQGVPLATLLDRVGVRPAGTQIMGHSDDGFTAGFPTEIARDGRVAMVALTMNGEPLPADHGYPARIVVAGLYGYVSAVKWLTRLQLVGWDEAEGYWIPRGWAKEGPIKTQSRIDVPRSGAKVAAGAVDVGGIAWAPTRGISAVEVQVDDGPWQKAELGAAASDNTWVQWHWRWPSAEKGSHLLRVRATDGDGAVQPGTPSPVAPDGATGHHVVSITVTG